MAIEIPNWFVAQLNLTYDGSTAVILSSAGFDESTLQQPGTGIIEIELIDSIDPGEGQVFASTDGANGALGACGFISADGVVQADTRDDGANQVNGGLTLIVTRIRTGPDGPRVEGIETDDGVYSCRDIVVATGAWAATWGNLANLPVQLQPYRRHLVSTVAGEWKSDGWPWVWDLENRYYFRSESGGLLWSPCDDIPDQPGDARADEDAPERLAARIQPVLPKSASLEPLRFWAGHRTLAPDRRFLLGRLNYP